MTSLQAPFRHVVAHLRATAGVCLRLVVIVTFASTAMAPPAVAAARPDRELYLEAQKAHETLKRTPKRQASKAEWESVVLRYRRVVARFPQSVYCDDALLNVGHLYRDMAQRFKVRQYGDDAITAYRALLSEYSSSSKGEEALFAIFEITRARDDRRRTLAAGRAYLDAYPRGSHAATVTARMKAAPAPRPAAPATTPAPEPVRVRATEPSPASAGISTVNDLRFWSGETSTRVVLDLDKQVTIESDRIQNPDRLWIDLAGTRLHPNLSARAFPVGDGLLEQIRVAQNRDDVVRVVLDFKEVKDHQLFWLQNPLRLVIDVRAAERKLPPETVVASGPAPPVATPAPAPTPTAMRPPPPAPTPTPSPDQVARAASPAVPAFATPLPRPTATPRPRTTPTPAPAALRPAPIPSPTPYAEVISLPVRSVRAGPPPDVTPPSPRPTRAARVLEVKDERPTPKPPKAPKPTPTPKVARNKPSPTPAPPAAPPAVVAERTMEPARNIPPQSPQAPAANSNGSYSLARQLGLAARRIVIDAGHGGHDPGSIGPAGLQEKDITLDVALRLEKLIRAELPGAEVILTRSTDVFIPLEERTAIANSKGADLFLSIHANSSRNPKARGVETYFLSFAADPHAEAVAARENAISAATMKDLQNLVKAITLNSKIDESRDFAASVQDGLVGNLRRTEPDLPNRGVRTAPFYVLIGANMPSVLAEIAFVSNPADEKALKTEERRQVIAVSLLEGLQSYLNGLNRSRGAQLTRSGESSRLSSRGARR